MRTSRSRWLLGAFLLVAVCPRAHGQLQELLDFAGATKQEPTRQIAHFSLRGSLAETPIHMPPLFGGDPPESLKGLLERLDKARKDDQVVAVVLDLQNAALGLAQIEDVHDSLRKFAAIDKDVFVHADSLSTMTYALATAASQIVLVPTGDLWLTGLYAEAPYIRGGLDLLGITPDFEQCGNYKTGAESLTRTGPSEPAKKMSKWLFDGLYDALVARIAQGRGMTPDRVRELIDNGPYTAEEALAAKLIDVVQHRQSFAEELKQRFGSDIEVARNYGRDDGGKMPQDFFGMFNFVLKMLNPSPKLFTEPTVAIVFVEGMIQSGKAETTPFGTSSGAYSATIRKALDKAAEDDSVRAVVLRVDSPGGSALASEVILDATRRVARKKPLVVSMGNVAGSGGYYVACAAEAIFAQPSTITASIGVLGGKFITTDMWGKLGINWHPHQRGKMAGMMGTAAPFSTEERAKIRHYMETVYDTFRGHVVDARGDKLTKPIEELAGGRVFTGKQALDLGLVDKIGGLTDAIKFAANSAHLGEYEVRVIPEPPSIFDIFGGGGDDDEFLSSNTRGAALSLLNIPEFRGMLSVLSTTDPLRFAAVMRQIQKLELMHHEHVLTVMPDEFVIR